jgi:hypothetical protein
MLKMSGFVVEIRPARIIQTPPPKLLHRGAGRITVDAAERVTIGIMHSVKEILQGMVFSPYFWAISAFLPSQTFGV